MKPFRRNRGAASEGTTSSQLAAEEANRFDPGFAPLRSARPRKLDARPAAPRNEQPSGYSRSSFPKREAQPGDRPALARPEGRPEGRYARRDESRSFDRRPETTQSDRPTRSFEPLGERRPTRAFEPLGERRPVRAADTRGDSRSFDGDRQGDRPQRSFEPRGDRPAPRSFEPRGDRPAPRSFEPRGDRPPRSFEPRGDRPQRSFEPRGDRPAPRSFEPRGDRPAPRSFEPRGDRPAPRSFEPHSDRPQRSFEPGAFESRNTSRPQRSFDAERPAPHSFEPRQDRAPRSFEPRADQPIVATEPKFEAATVSSAPPEPARPIALPEGPIESFNDLPLIEPLLRAIAEAGITVPTPIQAKAIPHALMGRDLFGCAQTGTGKTAAFVLPVLQKLVSTPRAGRPVLRTLVLSPTRELAVQIAKTFERFARFTGIRHTVVYGGVAMGPQAYALRRGVDVLIATPGRLCDLMNQGLIDLSQIEVLVLDEADRMLDQGFQPVVSDLATQMPKERQTLFFSATMPPSIEPFARELLTDPVRVQVAAVASTPDRVEQSVYFVDQEEKRKLLQHLLQDPTITRAMVFTRTKFAADKVARMLTESEIRADAIHGDKTQGARQKALSSFKTGRVRVLVATDVAARGIDVDGVTHVINYDLPAEAEGYVHRIGRTARAGMDGQAWSFCAADERHSLSRIERLIRRRVTIVDEHPFKPEGSPTNASVAERDAMPREAPARRNFRPHGGDRFRNRGPRPS